MSKVYRWALLVREADTYTADESSDDITAALEQAGIELVELDLRGVEHERPAPPVTLVEHDEAGQ